jgi:hypothetical protein
LPTMVMLRRAGVVLIVAVLALGLGGAVAGAKKKKKKKGQVWSAKITLGHPSATQFTGTVDSKLGACLRGRLVNVFYTDPTGNTAHLSIQRTDGKGRFEVNLTQSAYPGTYQAQAAHERTRALKRPQTCKADTSNPIFI